MRFLQIIINSYLLQFLTSSGRQILQEKHLIEVIKGKVQLRSITFISSSTRNNSGRMYLSPIKPVCTELSSGVFIGKGFVRSKNSAMEGKFYDSQ